MIQMKRAGYKIVLGIILSLFLKIDHMHIEKTENKYNMMATNYFCLVSNRHFLFSNISKFYMITCIRVANCCYKHTHILIHIHVHTHHLGKREKSRTKNHHQSIPVQYGSGTYVFPYKNLLKC